MNERTFPIDLLPPLPKRYTRAEAIAAIEDIYAQLPALECKGRCHNSCTVAGAAELERQRITDAGGDLGQMISLRRLKSAIADVQLFSGPREGHRGVRPSRQVTGIATAPPLA